MNYYIIFDEDGNFRFLSSTPTPLTTSINEDEEGNTQEVIIEDLPVGAISISADQQAGYLDVLNRNLQSINLVNDVITIVDKYTPEELASKQAQEAATTLKNQAHAILIQTDRFEHDVYQSKMKDDESNEFDAWRTELLDVVLGDSSAIPATPEFMQKFLTL